MKMESIRIGTSYEFVTIRILAPATDDGWIQTEVEISVDGFQGRIRPFFQKADFERFLQDSKQLYRTLQGEAELRPRDEQFVIRLKAGRGGHIDLTGEAFSNATFGNRLTFEIAMDQTCLPESIKALEVWLETRPNPA